MKHKTSSLLAIAFAVSLLDFASAAERWQTLTGNVAYDATSMATEKDKDGDRITVTWIKFKDKQSQDVLIETHAICKDRVLTAWRQIIVKSDGTRQELKVSGDMDTTPGGPWEPALDAICAKAKPWWQAF